MIKLLNYDRNERNYTFLEVIYEIKTVNDNIIFLIKFINKYNQSLY